MKNRLALSLLFCTLPALAADDPALAGRIAAIEAGLQPAVALQGAAPVRLKLAEEMARLGVPGVSIAVIHAGDIEWAKGYGVVTPGGAAVTPATLFQAGSISKPVTAVGALKLVENGTLALDRDINSYTTYWKLPNNLGNGPVTLRQLLSHTAGTTVHGFPGYAAGAKVPTLVQVLNGAAPANSRGVHVTTRPGTKWRYSGGGYEVVQYVMAERSRQDFAALLQATVLQPLGMGDSTFVQPLPAALLSRAALPHDGKGKPVAGGPHTYPEQAAAGLWTTPSDLARFAIEIKRSAAGQSNKVLSQSMTQLMLAPVLENFGLGWRLDGDGQAQSFSHGGANAGYQNMLVAYTERGDGVVVMTNGDRGGDLAGEVVRAVATEYNWPSQRAKVRPAVATSAAALAALPGKYTIDGLGDFTIARRGDTLTIALREDAVEPLYAAPDGALFVTSMDAELRFGATNDRGRLTAPGLDTTFEKAK
ncbi:CubicO group peptidase (beta-lactamase class C family) [Pseudoduganella lurida]|uniref:CubicO group peptidase (Beta-lactamase class C family) n=1 Tax=Pseudoduganella lurida TaxID=1036180 RepID=A0A562RC75_9BURK|nr:serine hydrolase domain-containing protein [Pseudoduganella lurida]TWI66652.1 CubicO group peptidase (beta-lactamase class C family) [Pseudoduganella lurida]